MEYIEILVHVPNSEKLQKAVTLTRPISIKLDLLESPDDKLFITFVQKTKIEQATAAGRKNLTLRFTTKQAKYNKEAEGGFLGAMLSAASKFMPGIIAGLLAGLAESGREWNVFGKT